MNNRRWATCTPVAFRGDEKAFFIRDSGLCCRALQALGASAKVLMPEPAWNDEPDVLRVPYPRLGDPEFWRQQNVEAVILYSWADPHYTGVARAIRAGGAKLFLNMDTNGLISPFVEPGTYSRAVLWAERRRRCSPWGGMGALGRLGGQCLGLHKHYSRLQHMGCADAIGVVSPIAAERIRRYACFFGRNDLARRIHFVSHPIDPAMRYTGSIKQATVVAVGRWDDAVKCPDTLVSVASQVLVRHPTVQFILVGTQATRCAAAIAAKLPSAQNRVVGHEYLDHDQLCEKMNSSQISLCTSHSESFHIPSGEALLCGCTVVGPCSPLLPALDYFVEGGTSGRLAANTPQDLAEAVLAELAAWRRGLRVPATLSAVWRERLAARVVVSRIERLLFDPSEEGSAVPRSKT